MRKSYYVSYQGNVAGPYSAGTVVRRWKAGEFDTEAQICEQGIEEWMVLRYLIDELKHEAGMVTTPPPPIPQIQYVIQKPAYSALLAFLLSLIMPGLGQLYVGRFKEGIFWLGGMSVLIVGSIVTHAVVIGFLMALILCLFCAISAAGAAKRG